MKCEIEECKEQTESYLCEGHRELSKNKYAKFKICNNCNSIVAVRVDRISKDLNKKKYTFVKECQTCKFK